MNCLGDISTQTTSMENCILPSEVNSCAPLTVDAGELGHTISTTRALPQMSLSGVVDAIREVGIQRKALFCRLRSALESGSDSEALGFARQLCGLAA